LKTGNKQNNIDLFRTSSPGSEVCGSEAPLSPRAKQSRKIPSVRFGSEAFFLFLFQSIKIEANAIGLARNPFDTTPPRSYHEAPAEIREQANYKEETQHARQG
jgi:hypothetical protein